MAKTLISGTSCEMFYKGLKSSKTSEEGQVIEDALGTVQSNFPLQKEVFTAFCNFFGSIQIASVAMKFSRELKSRDKHFTCYHILSPLPETVTQCYITKKERLTRSILDPLSIISSTKSHAHCVPHKIMHVVITTLQLYNN